MNLLCNHRPSRALSCAVLGLGLFVSGCGDSEPAAQPSARTPTPPAAAPAAPAKAADAPATPPAKPPAREAARTDPAAKPKAEAKAKASPDKASSQAKSDLIRSLSQSKVGDFMVMEASNGVTTRTIVVKVAPKAVTLRFVNAVPNQPNLVVSQKRVSLEAGPMAEVAIQARGKLVGTETLTVGDRPVRCRVYQAEHKGTIQKTWVSDDVPVLGMVKTTVTRDGKVIKSSELTDFGRK